MIKIYVHVLLGFIATKHDSNIFIKIYSVSWTIIQEH